MSDLENSENIIIVHSEEDLDLLRDTKHSIDEPNRVEWSHEATKELLKIYDEKVDMLDTGIISTHKKIWELTSRLLAKKGFYYNSTQCENKWKALKGPIETN
ncbi:hypothetical protein NQ317_000384 [Molorchus minor]|uniref:Myb/SANT-like DNA-binding domain-containing protein n=1 Tax=Molorchus minor TaxID=1323400 RepID=A0ABQ9J9C2_9CUCU|nr:hypothetical protein NQ317_000384 [Molorchus minor]